MQARARVWRRRNVIIAMAVVGGMVVLATLGWLLYFRATYGTFAWWQTPPRIRYCGREYDRGATVGVIPSQDYTLVQVMTIEPAGRAVYAKQPVQDTTLHVANLPCTMGLVVAEGDHYVQYGLSGGP